MEEQVIKEIVAVFEKYKISVNEAGVIYKRMLYYIQNNTPVNTATKPTKLYD